MVDPATGNLLFATGNGNYDGKTAWGDALIMLDRERHEDARQLDDDEQRGVEPARPRHGLDLSRASRRRLHCAGRKRRHDPAADHGHHQRNRSRIRAANCRWSTIPARRQLLSGSATAKINGTTYLFAAQGGRGGGGTTAWTFGPDHKLTEAWKNTTGGNTPFVAGGLVFIYDAQGGHVRVFDAVTGNAVATLDCGGGHWNSVIVVDNRIALPEGAISGFGGVGGGGGRGRGGAAGAAPAPAPAAPAAPATPPPGIVNIWRLP